MNYLEAVNRLRQETNYANTGPVTVVGQVGDHARSVSWVADAYTELQNRHPWRWLQGEFTITTTAGVSEYSYTQATDVDSATPISRFSDWHIDDPYNPPKVYLSSAGAGTEYWLTYIPWEQYRTIYGIGNFSDSSPSHITVDPGNKIHIGPGPNDAYVITGEYNKSPQILTADTDTPEMPSAYHMIIVYMAMEDAGFFDVAEEVIARGQKKGRKLLRQLEANQLPPMRMAGPLV
jgi:hypothetical protein